MYLVKYLDGAGQRRTNRGQRTRDREREKRGPKTKGNSRMTEVRSQPAPLQTNGWGGRITDQARPVDPNPMCCFHLDGWFGEIAEI